MKFSINWARGGGQLKAVGFLRIGVRTKSGSITRIYVMNNDFSDWTARTYGVNNDFSDWIARIYGVNNDFSDFIARIYMP